MESSDAIVFADPSRSLVNARQVDLGNELHSRRNIWIIVTAVNVQAVNAILMSALGEESLVDHSVLSSQPCDSHAGDPGLSHSNLTLTGRLHPRDRKSMPLTPGSLS